MTRNTTCMPEARYLLSGSDLGKPSRTSVQTGLAWFLSLRPRFRKVMRCGSVPAGQTAPPINTDELKACTHEGHVEFEALRPAENIRSRLRTGHPPKRERTTTARSV